MRTAVDTNRTDGRPSGGFTLVELLVAVTITGVALFTVTSIMLSSSRLQSRTSRRADVQAASRQVMALMSTEIRQAGADPGNPPIGVSGLAAGQANMIRVRADLDGNGAISTAEPSEDVTYAYNDTTGVILRDPGTGAQPILDNVTGMTFDYFDEDNALVTPLPLSVADAARVRSIGLSITSMDRDSQPFTLTTRITMRNL